MRNEPIICNYCGRLKPQEKFKMQTTIYTEDLVLKMCDTCVKARKPKKSKSSRTPGDAVTRMSLDTARMKGRKYARYKVKYKERAPKGGRKRAPIFTREED